MVAYFHESILNLRYFINNILPPLLHVHSEDVIVVTYSTNIIKHPYQYHHNHDNNIVHTVLYIHYYTPGMHQLCNGCTLHLATPDYKINK